MKHLKHNILACTKNWMDTSDDDDDDDDNDDDEDVFC